jgi:glutamyl-tRNA reductase
MSRLLLTHLASKGCTSVLLLNRGLERAEELAAQFPGVEVTCAGMEALDDALKSYDAVFTSTGATHCIVTQEQLQAIHPPDRKLMLVDISVPRNVELQCNEVAGVSAYNVDDLKAVVAKNQASRRRSVLEAEALLASELDGFLSWARTLDFVPVIGKMQANAETIRAAELAKVSGKLNGLDPKQMEAVERCTKSIINKILHSPMTYLRKDAGEQLSTREIVEGLFDL